MKTRVFAAAIAALVLAFATGPALSQEFVRDANGSYWPTGHAVQTTPQKGVRSGNCPLTLGCGCNLANYFHIVGKRWRELWVARAWAKEGRPAAKGCVNCVAVLTRGKRGGHVGIVKSYDANGNPAIYSYANRRLGWVTTKYSAKRVIAYRQL
jgi:hypothetical protein